MNIKRLIVMLVALSVLTGCMEESFEKPKESNIKAEEGNSYSNEALAAETNQQQTNHQVEAQVIRVIDGDTFIASVQNKEEKIRMLLIDTPESVKPGTTVEPFAEEASQTTKSILPKDKKVNLEMDVSERDQYGRLLAYVYVDGKMVNETLLEKGLARVVVFQPNVKHIERFREIQKSAQGNGHGIWSKEDYRKE